MNSVQNYSSWQLIRDLLGLIRSYRAQFWWGLLLRFTGDLCWLYPAYALATLVNFFTTYHSGDSLEPFWLVFWSWIGLSLYRYVSQDVSKYFVFQVAEKAALSAQTETIRHLFALDLVWHERENSGNKLKRLQKGGEGVVTILRMVVINMMEIIVNFGGMVVVLSFLDRRLAVCIGIFLVLYLFLSIVLTRRAAQASQVVNIQEEEFQGVIFEMVNNVQTVTVLRLKAALMRILKRISEKLIRKIKTRIYYFRLRNMVLQLCGQSFRLAVVGIAVWGIVRGDYAVGFLVLAYGYFDRIWQSASELSEVSNDFVIAKYGIQRMMEILHEPIRIENESGKHDFPQDWKEIAVEGLSFGYETKKVLQDLSFTIRRGEKIGIVGLSGAGKSTLFKLFLKQREEYAGEIRFDAMPLKKIKKSSYLKHVAVVLQETELFNMSLKENILIASPDEKFHPERFRRALEISHVRDFTSKLPQGVETLIGEKGIKLSGGERQRLGIARAVFRHPEILFLDEATSHLDIESERKIQDSLHRFFDDITAVVIAHRLSTLREMDRILVLEKGKIIEQGSFATLMKKKGRFRTLWEKQQFLP